jgi:hypothetical protein
MYCTRYSMLAYRDGSRFFRIRRLSSSTLVDHSHVDVVEEQNILKALQPANADDWQHALAAGLQIVHNVAHVLRKPRTGARKPRHHNGYPNLVGLALLLFVSRNRRSRLRVHGRQLLLLVGPDHRLRARFRGLVLPYLGG